MDEPVQSGGSVYWGETGIPLKTFPRSSLVVAPGEIETGNRGCIWDFMQLMGQCEGPYNFIVFSTKKPQFYAFYSAPLYFKHTGTHLSDCTEGNTELSSPPHRPP